MSSYDAGLVTGCLSVANLVVKVVALVTDLKIGNTHINFLTHNSVPS